MEQRRRQSAADLHQRYFRFLDATERHLRAAINAKETRQAQRAVAPSCTSYKLWLALRGRLFQDPIGDGEEGVELGEGRIKHEARTDLASELKSKLKSELRREVLRVDGVGSSFDSAGTCIILRNETFFFIASSFFLFILTLILHQLILPAHSCV